MEKACENCTYLIKDENKLTCQVTSPGQTTVVEDETECVCPKWESKSLKCYSKGPRKPKDEHIVYEIIR